MKKGKLLSVLLVLAMLLTLLPATGTAATKADTGGAIITNKHTTLEEDGSYTIELEAYSTGTVDSITMRKPTDIVIVMDVSGSMSDPDWGTDGAASWQVFNGWATTALQLQNERGQQFYHNHGGKAYAVELQQISNYTGTVYRFSNGSYRSAGTVTNKDVFGYRCNYGACNSAYGSNYYYTYRLSNNGTTVSFTDLFTMSVGSDAMLSEDVFALWRNTSDITRMAALQNAVNAFIDTTAAANVDAPEDQQHRIALIKFAGLGYQQTGNQFYSPNELDSNGNFTTLYNSYATGYTNVSQVLYEMNYVNSSTTTTMKNLVNSLVPAGATHAQNGAYLALEEVQKNIDSGREQIVLFFTDGEPTTGVSFETNVANGAIEYARAIKETGAKVFTINMMPESATTADMTKYMNYVSSNYPDAQNLSTPGAADPDGNYYKQVHDMTDLSELFDEVSATISSTTVTLTEVSQLRDYLADGFELPEDTRIVVQTVEYNGNNTWETPVTVQEYPENPAYADSPIKIIVNPEEQSVFVEGFSYRDNFIHEEYMSGAQLVPAGGTKLVLTIYGVHANDEAIQGGYTDTNKPNSGVYADGDPNSPPVQSCPIPNVRLLSRTYVWDFGRPAYLDGDDWQQSTVYHLGTSMAAFDEAASSLSLTYGTASLEGNSGLNYYPKTMQWGGYDTFYAYGTDTEEVNSWVKINIIPANNVYFEDDFITGDLNVEDGIVYTGGSKPQGMSDEEWAALQNAWETIGSGEGSQEDPNGEVHGWISDLSEAASYSDGAAHMVAAISGQTNAQLPSARFSFTGTGMDIYSFTDSTTGTIMVSVAKRGGSTQYFIVDNYAASGSYYQIPTVTYSGDYGTYDVTIYVTAAAGKEDRFTFYLDGIRIYNPLGDSFNEDEVVNSAYAGEMNAVFTELRNILSDGAVFIDKDAEGNTSVEMDYNASDYARYAPEHEVYLAEGQSVTFAVADGTANYFVGLKSLAGGATTAHVGKGNDLAAISVNHTTDLYYRVVPYYDSTSGRYVITIKNAGTNLLSITKLRQTSQEARSIRLESITEAEALRYAQIFDSMSVITYVRTSDVDQVLVERPLPEKEELSVVYEQLRHLIEKLFAGLHGWF